MKLEQLYPDFTTLSEREQLAFVRNYRNKRFMDLQTYIPSDEARPRKKRASHKKKVKAPISTKDLDLLKKLGLTAGQINKMRK